MKVKFDIKKNFWIILAALAFAGVLYVNNNILITSFDQLLYGGMKLKGSGVSTVLYAVIYMFISFIIMLMVLLLPIIDFGKKINIKIKNKILQLYPIKNVKCYGITLLILSLICLLYVFDFFPFVKNNIFSNTKIFDDYYIDSSNVEISFLKEKNNLIYIFVESLESSNVSIQNGGLFDKSIIPNLERLALDNVNFSNNEKIGGAKMAYGTGWTVAAMIAQTSGVPLKVSYNDFGINSTRFSNVTSIGDILSANGYNNYLLLGSDADFGGRRAYFSNHNYLISDYHSAMEEGKIDKDYYEWWGYEDSKLFSYAKEKLELISKDDKPFNLTILTADTHFTDGYLDKSCNEVFDDDYANSFYCSDSMIYDFIQWVKQQEFYKNTTIVIVGDHFTMQDGFYDDDNDKRSIYNVFINAKIYNDFEDKNRIFTSLDMLPTTIAAIGGNIEGDRLGLGTNLFSSKKTIPEMIGIDKFNDELMKYSHYYYNYIRK